MVAGSLPHAHKNVAEAEQHGSTKPNQQEKTLQYGGAAAAPLPARAPLVSEDKSDAVQP